MTLRRIALHFRLVDETADEAREREAREAAKRDRPLPRVLAVVASQALAAGLTFALLNLLFGSDNVVARGVFFGAFMGLIYLGDALWKRRKDPMRA
jgi:hypothetical protein